MPLSEAIMNLILINPNFMVLIGTKATDGVFQSSKLIIKFSYEPFNLTLPAIALDLIHNLDRLVQHISSNRCPTKILSLPDQKNGLSFGLKLCQAIIQFNTSLIEVKPFKISVSDKEQETNLIKNLNNLNSIKSHFKIGYTRIISQRHYYAKVAVSYKVSFEYQQTKS